MLCREKLLIILSTYVAPWLFKELHILYNVTLFQIAWGGGRLILQDSGVSEALPEKLVGDSSREVRGSEFSLLTCMLHQLYTFVVMKIIVRLQLFILW